MKHILHNIFQSTNILSTTDRIKVNTREEKDYVQGILNFTSVIKEDDAQYTCYAKNRAIDSAAEGSGELVVQSKYRYVCQTFFHNFKLFKLLKNLNLNNKKALRSFDLSCSKLSKEVKF